MSCGVGHRCGLDLVLLWLWHRSAAVAPIRPLIWESPYAVEADFKKKKKKAKKIFKIKILIPYPSPRDSDLDAWGLGPHQLSFLKIL